MSCVCDCRLALKTYTAHRTTDLVHKHVTSVRSDLNNYISTCWWALGYTGPSLAAGTRTHSCIHMLTSVQWVFLKLPTSQSQNHLRNPSHIHVRTHRLPPSQQVVTSLSAQIWSAVKAGGVGLGGGGVLNDITESCLRGGGEWREKTSERPRGTRKVRGRSLMETGRKKSERSTKSNWEGTCREDRKNTQRGIEVAPHPHQPPLIFASTRSPALVMGNRGSQEQQDSQGRCCLGDVPLLFIKTLTQESVFLPFSLSPIFPPFPSLRWCGLLTIFRLPLVSNTGSVIWVREWGRAGWLLPASHGALFSLTVVFFKPRSCESGVQPILGPLTRPGSIAETFPYRLVGF